MTDEAKTNAIKIQQSTIEDMTNQTNDVHSSLVLGNENNQLPEEIFVEYFLPFMAGKIPIVRESTVVTDWISVAGTPMSEVDLIDKAGNVILTVPSFFDTSNINTEERKPGESFTDIYSHYDMKMQNIPSAANNFLANQLEKKINNISSEKRDRWSDILQRYGYETLATTASKVDMDADDDVVYD